MVKNRGAGISVLFLLQESYKSVRLCINSFPLCKWYFCYGELQEFTFLRLLFSYRKDFATLKRESIFSIREITIMRRVCPSEARVLVQEEICR